MPPVPSYAYTEEAPAAAARATMAPTTPSPARGSHVDCYSVEADGGTLRCNGHEFYIKGLNWFGPEGRERVPFGLWERPMRELLGFVAEHEFNTIRLFFSMQNLNENKPTRGGYDAQANPELAGTDYIGMLQAVVRAAAEHGLLVVLANHQLRSGYPDDWPGSWDGNWFEANSEYDKQVPPPPPARRQGSRSAPARSPRPSHHRRACTHCGRRSPPASAATRCGTSSASTSCRKRTRSRGPSGIWRRRRSATACCRSARGG